MSDPRILINSDGAIATITIARPEKLNALDAAMVDALASACREIEHQGETRAVILTGQGSKAFCAGGDIADWSGKSPGDFWRFWIREGHDAFAALARLRQPVIAVMSGHCFGGGLELAACADLRVAEKHVKVGQPETGLGIIPGWSGTQRAVRRFGAQAVRRMSVMGETFDAEIALRLGIIDHLVPTGQGMMLGLELAKLVASRAPIATEITKMLVNAAEGEERERPLEAIAGAFAASTSDLTEGVAAFREKRTAIFRGQ